MPNNRNFRTFITNEVRRHIKSVSRHVVQRLIRHMQESTKSHRAYSLKVPVDEKFYGWIADDDKMADYFRKQVYTYLKSNKIYGFTLIDWDFDSEPYVEIHFVSNRKDFLITYSNRQDEAILTI